MVSMDMTGTPIAAKYMEENQELSNATWTSATDASASGQMPYHVKDVVLGKILFTRRNQQVEWDNTSNYTFYLRGRTVWDTNVFSQQTLKYVAYPCSSTSHSITVSDAWKTELGGTIQNRTDIWYLNENGTNYYPAPAIGPIMVSSEDCCPVIGYRIYLGDGKGNVVGEHDPAEIQLIQTGANETYEGTPTIKLNQRLVYEKPMHQQELIITGLTAGKEEGKFHIMAKVRECTINPATTLSEQWICPLEDQTPAQVLEKNTQHLTSFFNVAWPVADDGAYCNITSYHLEDNDDDVTDDNELEAEILKNSMSFSAGGKSLVSTRDTGVTWGSAANLTFYLRARYHFGPMATSSDGSWTAVQERTFKDVYHPMHLGYVAYPCKQVGIEVNSDKTDLPGRTASNRHPLWYYTKQGTTFLSIENDLLGANTPLFKSSTTCCPLTEYRIYADADGEAQGSQNPMEGSLAGQFSLSTARIRLDTAALYAKAGRSQTFVLRGVTPGGEAGFFYMEARYRECAESSTTLMEQYVCPAQQTSFATITATGASASNSQPLASFFDVGSPASSGAHCSISSYNLENDEYSVQTDNSLSDSLLTASKVEIVNSKIRTIRNVEQLYQSSASFYIRATTAWDTNVYKKVTLSYLDYPCSSSEYTLTTSLPTSITAGTSADNRHILWYSSRTGTTKRTIYNAFGSAQMDLFDSTQPCCPLVSYKLYKDDGNGNKVGGQNPYWGALSNQNDLQTAAVELNNAAVYDLDGHSENFVLKGLTTDGEKGTFYFRAQYRECSAAETPVLADAYVCPAAPHTEKLDLTSLFNVGSVSGSQFTYNTHAGRTYTGGEIGPVLEGKNAITCKEACNADSSCQVAMLTGQNCQLTSSRTFTTEEVPASTSTTDTSSSNVEKTSDTTQANTGKRRLGSDSAVTSYVKNAAPYEQPNASTGFYCTLQDYYLEESNEAVTTENALANSDLSSVSISDGALLTTRNQQMQWGATSTASFYVRGVTTWDSDPTASSSVYRALTLNYVAYPCSTTTHAISVHQSLSSNSATNRHILWYYETSESEAMSLVSTAASPFSSLPAGQNIFTSSQACCPITGYKLYKDDDGTPATTENPSEAPLLKQNDLENVQLNLNRAEVFAKEGHEQTFVLRGVTAGMEGGKYYMVAKYRKCTTTDQMVKDQYICPAYSTTNTDLVQSFFNLGQPSSASGFHCTISSYHVQGEESATSPITNEVLKASELRVQGQELVSTRVQSLAQPSQSTFYLRARTTWGTDVFQQLTLNYTPFPCGSGQLSLNAPAGSTKGMSAQNRLTLWYESQTGSTEFTLQHLLRGAKDPIDVFKTSELCCPVLQYNFYKDVDGNILTLTPPSPDAALDEPKSMSTAKIVLDHSAVFSQPNHIQTFILRGQTSAGLDMGALYLQAEYRECFASEENTDYTFQFCSEEDQPPITKLRKDFFTVGTLGCQMSSYHLENSATAVTNNDQLQGKVLEASVSTTSAKSGPSIAVSRQMFVKSASTHSFFLRGRTAWGVDIRKPINIQYEDPCGQETISIHGGVKQMLWNEEKRRGEFKEGVGLTEDNRYTLWYGLKGGKTTHNLFAADFAGIGYNEHLMSTNVLSTCCPVTGYRMFKDDQGQAVPKYEGTEVALQKEDLLDQAHIVIDNAAMEALPYKEQTFVLQGVTSNANTGTSVGVHKQPMFYMKVAFSECFPSQQNTDFAFDIQAVGVAQKPLGKFA
jgi:hypothetical protein